MRIWFLFVAFLISNASVLPATAASRTDLRDCTQSKDNNLKIAACTRVMEDKTQPASRLSSAADNRCLAYIHIGDYARAAADCMESTHLNPRNSAAWNNLGNARMSSGDFDGAIAAYDMALRIGPMDPLTIANLAVSWQEKGDDDRAIALFGEAIRLSPANPGPYKDRAFSWSQKGEFDKAIADASEAIRLQPNSWRLYAARGLVWRLKGDLDRALQDQNRAIEMESNAPLSFMTRGDTYRYLGELDRALADYSHALKLTADYIAAYTGRGLTYEKMGDLVHARAEFERALNSPTQSRWGVERSGLETARAHIAAIDSGIAPPAIPAAPAKAATTTSIPTPQAVIPTTLPAAPAKQGRRVALVLGNSTYRNVPALPNPERDAGVVAKSLRAIGFDTVTIETNGSREQMINALRNFAGEAEKADWAIVYYAGHGIEMNGVNYLIPVDAKFATDRDVQFEAIPFDQVMAALEGAKKLKLVLLDACRDNPFAPQMRQTAPPGAVAATSTAGAAVGTRSIGRGLGEVKVSGATLVVFAAKQGQTALDGDGEDSPFAVAVVQRIATPGVEINKVFRLVRDDVMEATAGRQEPYTYGSLPGSEDFFFVQR